MAATAVPLLPFDVWPAGIEQAATPANDNAMRSEVLASGVVSIANTEPGSPSDYDLYIIGTTWAGYPDEVVGTLAYFLDGTWYFWVPFEGLLKNVGGTLYEYTSGAWAIVTVPAAGRETVTALSGSGSVAIDYALGDYFTLALTGDVTDFTFSNLPGSGKGATLMIRITQDSAPRTVTWPSSFKWAGGAAGAVSTSSGAVDVLAITTFDNGTTWQATLAKDFA